MCSHEDCPETIDTKKTEERPWEMIERLVIFNLILFAMTQIIRILEILFPFAK